MGMAASQARFLSLTARKSNLEYEGQQINQQRTALANESSNLFTQLSKLDVPTPPNVNDFYKPVYRFTTSQLDGEKLEYTVESLNNTPSGMVANLSHKDPFFASKAIDIYGTIGEAPADTKPSSELLNGEATPLIINVNGKSKFIYQGLADNHQAQLGVINNDTYIGQENLLTNDTDTPVDQGTGFVYFYQNDNNDYVYLNAQDIENYIQNGDKNVDAAMLTAQEYKTVYEEFDVINMVTNNVGRTTQLTLEQVDENGVATQLTAELECTSEMDEAEYDQAMLDYEYENAKYQKAMSDLNSKTEAIQAKDKTLELELKRLDTEQNAISTEMDAVTKVVEDNVEKTFKTFA